MKAAELEALGRRAVACPRWRWLPGTAVLRYAPGTPSHGQRQARVDDEFVTYEQALGVHIVPDLTDPATLGCLLALVREAHGDADIVAFVVHSHGSPERWCVDVGPDPDFYDERKYVYRPTEVEALVTALEVAT